MRLLCRHKVTKMQRYSDEAEKQEACNNHGAVSPLFAAEPPRRPSGGVDDCSCASIERYEAHQPELSFREISQNSAARHSYRVTSGSERHRSTDGSLVQTLKEKLVDNLYNDLFLLLAIQQYNQSGVFTPALFGSD